MRKIISNSLSISFLLIVFASIVHRSSEKLTIATKNSGTTFNVYDVVVTCFLAKPFWEISYLDFKHYETFSAPVTILVLGVLFVSMPNLLISESMLHLHFVRYKQIERYVLLVSKAIIVRALLFSFLIHTTVISIPLIHQGMAIVNRTSSTVRLSGVADLSFVFIHFISFAIMLSVIGSAVGFIKIFSNNTRAAIVAIVSPIILLVVDVNVESVHFILFDMKPFSIFPLAFSCSAMALYYVMLKWSKRYLDYGI